jgi:hypothetical protein
MPPHPLDPANPEAEIAKAAQAYSNWGRWGDADVLGTVNFLTAETRRAAARLVRRGASFSLAQRFDMNGPQRGWRRRTNPVHTMLYTGFFRTAAPLPTTGTVGSPINPIAVK